MDKLNLLKNKFNQDILFIIEESKKIGYNPSRFIQMFYENNNDGVLLATKLIPQKETDGYTTLWQKGRLDLTLEALVTQSKYNELFNPEIIEIARKRLIKSGYKNFK